MIVGPKGVFVVETKTKRKAVQQGQKQYEVIFDGTALLFPHGRDTDGLEQARRNVKSFSGWLASATGYATNALGIVTNSPVGT